MFSLHKRLEQDTFFVGDLDLCRVLLMNDAQYPWLILVPRRVDIKETIDLTETEQMMLMSEISFVSKVFKTMLRPDKLNVAALGNMVPQLHVHVIARYKDDPAWPNPVWGFVEAKPYQQAAQEEVLERLREKLFK